MQPALPLKKVLFLVAVLLWFVASMPWTRPEGRSMATQEVGVKILRRAIEEPLRQIVNNAGEERFRCSDKVAEGKGDYRLQRGDR